MLILGDNQFDKHRIEKIQKENDEYWQQERSIKKLKKQFFTVQECYFKLIDIEMIKSIESAYWDLESKYYKIK